MPDELKTDWRSIYIVTILTYIGSLQFTLFFSALWPYLQILDPTISEFFFGIAVALVSLGQVIGSPGFGYWSNRVQSVTPPLYCGLYLMLFGNVAYLAMAPTLSWMPLRWLLLIGRFASGLGSGNVAVLRTYASTASTSADQSKAIAYVTCGQALGLTTGPIFQLLFTPIKYPGLQLVGGINLDMYTLPGFLGCLMNIFGLFLLYFYFNESYAGLAECQNSKTKVKLPKYDWIAVFANYAARFVDTFVRSILETLSSPLSMLMFGFTKYKSVTYTALAQSGVGVITSLVYAVYIGFSLDRFINHRVGCILSLAILALFHIVTYAWPFLPHIQAPLNNSVDIGCDPTKFTWCSKLTVVNPIVFFASYAIFVGLAFPLINITTNTLFSQILGARRQGTQQGLMQMAVGLGRMVGPICASGLYSISGPRPVWIMSFILIVLVLISWLVLYKRLVPLRIPPEFSAPNNRYTVISPVLTNDAKVLGQTKY